MLGVLVPELLDHILNYCPIKDLKNLSATNTKFNLHLQQRLYHTVKIPEKSKNARRVRKHLHLLHYTKVLFMAGYDYSLPHTIVEAISTLSGLQVLDFTQSRVDDGDVEVVCGGVSLLRVLRLSRSKVTSTGCEHISRLGALEELFLNGCDVEDDGIQFLARLTKLRVLDLSCRYVTGRAFGAASNLRSLDELYLVNTNVYDGALEHIAKFENLKKLDISKSYLITNSGVYHISTLPMLNELNISYCMALNSECVCHILDMEALKTLDIRGMDNITDIENVLRPEIDINWDFYSADNSEPMYLFHPLYNNINAMWDYDVVGEMGYPPGWWYPSIYDDEDIPGLSHPEGLDDHWNYPVEDTAVCSTVSRERIEHEKKKSWVKKEKVRPLTGNGKRGKGNIDQRNKSTRGYQRR